MKQYIHNIGDYIKNTAHLSLLEHGAYFRLLDVYYNTEKQLPKEKNVIFKLVRAFKKTEREAIENILGEFFIETETGFYHKRCEEEIAKARKKSGKGAI